ncbi:WxL domain-containing protein [Vagococcus intermedius]|uniref:WxL domain-containing protein n=1 Tax=Vagococcus intermedius TaxID=2991418 RepID=A0AAF0CVF3_9ENTE|nr:WxL domain-containing protein [Vagococcus intermedius]WEG73613.1 WxL domain-containing protein [Vagococcus intermedius]WEG75697.1 WxL domain-containing protein [Vagococcus intermedius]
MMKTTKFLGLLMATTILGTTGTVLVSADEKSPTEVSTKAEVSFTPNEGGETPPTDPGNPGEEVEPPEGGGETGGKGALRIDWASNFDFGANEIKNGGGDLVLPVLRKNDQKLAHFVQVSDLRGEDEPDWTLSVKTTALEKQVSESEDNTRTDKDKITGAKITFKPAPILATGSNSSEEPTEKPVWEKEMIDLDGNDAQTLVSANGDGARGTWSMGMSDKVKGEELTGGKDDAINLVIPQSEVGKIRKGSYKAALNWNLSSTIVSEKAGFMAPTTK